MASPKAEDVRALNELISSTLALLKQFSTSLKSTDTTTTPIESPPNPLHVLRDAATLLKAHTTKLSLLAINKPFTPTALTKVLRDLSGTCLPAMMSSAQICQQEHATCGSLMAREVQVRVARVFREMENLLSEVQSIAHGNNAPAKRDTLSSTGVVWESCDALVELEQIGIAGLAVKKAEQYRDSIKDAIEELREWREGEDEENEGQGDELLDSDDEGVDGDKDSVEDLFNAANSMPKDRPELRELVDRAEATGKKLILLHTALIKRRLKTYKGGNEKAVKTLDCVLQQLKTVQEDVDEAISQFYDLDEDGATSQLKKCIKEAKAAASLVHLSWDDNEDEFSAWSKKWEEAIG